jgi:carbon monoxide dehydrogenase subunit G
MKFTHSIDIQAPLEEVFAWIKDPEKAKEWMTSVGETEMLSGSPNEVGSTFREVVSNEAGSTELYGEVTGYRENEMLSFHLRGQYNLVDVQFRVRPVGAYTRVIQQVDMRFRSFLKVTSLLFAGRLRQEIGEQAQAEFARLKELCEAKQEDDA